MVAPASPVLDRLLDPIADCLTAESADKIARLSVDPSVQRRLDELADKASAGTLSESERSEYTEFVEAIDLVAIIQAKARRRGSQP